MRILKRVKKTGVVAIETVLRFVFRLLPIHNTIIFESKPAYSDNTYAVFTEFLKLGLDKKYHLLWFVEPECTYHYESDNVSSFVVKNTLGNLFRRMYLLQTASGVICSNSRFYSTRDGHRNIYLCHGSPMKDTGRYMYLNKYFDYITLQSSYFRDIARKAYNIPIEKMVITGFPRTDYLLQGEDPRKKALTRGKYNSVIFWLPTFRKTGKGNRVDSEYYMPYGIPILQNDEDWVHLNSILKNNNSLLMIKHHFAQDESNHSNMKYSNITVIGNDFFYDNDIQLYEVLRYTDALITDYSSVYFEYLLLERPIGLTIDDLEEYVNKRGLMFKDYFSDIPGSYISNRHDLYSFVEAVCQHNITFSQTMQKAKEKYNDYFDLSSASRVTQFLIKSCNI